MVAVDQARALVGGAPVRRGWCRRLATSVVPTVLICLLLVLATERRAAALPWFAKHGVQRAVESFKSFSKCVRRMERRLPPEVSALLLGTSALEFLCHTHEAVATEDPSVCNREIHDYRLRKRCRRFYAVYRGHARSCPTRGHPAYHEALCYALASRAPSLCRAVAPDKRPLCMAVLYGHKRCGKLPPAKRAPCVAQARAWKGLLKPNRPSLPRGYTPKLHIDASVLKGRMVLPKQARSFDSDQLAHGVLVAEQPGKGDWFAIDRRLAPLAHGAHRSRPPIRLELWVPLGGSSGAGRYAVGPNGGGARVRFRAATRRHRYVRMQASSGQVAIDRYERKPGGRIAGSFTLDLSDGVDSIRVSGSFDSFVRQLVPLARVRSYMRYRTRRRTGRGRLAPKQLALLKRRVRQVKHDVYDVDPSVRDQLANDTSKITYGGSISRHYHYTHGKRKPTGYKLYSVYRNGALWQLGLRDGDVVEKINGISLVRPEAAYAAYGRLKRRRRIRVELSRGGKPLTLTYRIRRVRRTPKAERGGHR